MTPQTVTIKVPPVPDCLALVRQAVWTYAARESFTLEQMDDLRMAVEEAAVQVLRHATGEASLDTDATITDEAMEVRVTTTVHAGPTIIDETSFAWQILQALVDEVKVEQGDERATIILVKRRTVFPPAQDSA